MLNSLNDKLRLAVTVAQTHHDRFHSLAALFRIVVTAPQCYSYSLFRHKSKGNKGQLGATAHHLVI